jgi:NAD-dependent deacetylase
MHDIRNVVILTGAGISAESGLATFRGPDGLWEGHRVEDVATPEAFLRDPELVQRFYDARRAQLREVSPNAAHLALARLDAQWPGELLIVTQMSTICTNAAARGVSCTCMASCGRPGAWPVTGGPAGRASCRAGRLARLCGAPGQMRPDIVWFGEMPYGMDGIERALMQADLFVSIGTSGAVYPAAGFVQTARYRGTRTLELNLEPSAGSPFFDTSRFGPAGSLCPNGSMRCCPP